MIKAPFTKKGSGFSKAVYHIFFQNANVCSGFLKKILPGIPFRRAKSGLPPVSAEREARFASERRNRAGVPGHAAGGAGFLPARGGRCFIHKISDISWGMLTIT